MKPLFKPAMMKQILGVMILLLLIKLVWVAIEVKWLPAEGIDHQEKKSAKPLYYRIKLTTNKTAPLHKSTIRKPIESIKDIKLLAVYNASDTTVITVKYKGKTIHEVLAMSVEEARDFFSAIPVLSRKLQTLMDVGLSYVTLGQNAVTLSGGEAQRIKLAKELSKRDTGKTLYILDEPTTGLHFHDVELLLNVLHRLRDHGNTVVVIEHNLDVVKTADWIVDLGPEGGDKGGQIIATGTPENIAKNKKSYTGMFLKGIL